MEYETFPFLKFCRISEDNSLLEKYGISQDDWDKVYDKYLENHKDAKLDSLIESYRKVLIEGAELNKKLGLMKFILTIETDWKPLFETAKIRFSGEKQKDVDYLMKLIKQSEEKEKIYKAKFEQLEKRLKDEEEQKDEEKYDLKHAYEAISTFEMHGIFIPDYEVFTLGKKDALTKSLKEKNKNNK